MSIEIGKEFDSDISKLAVKASGWILFGHFWGQFIRFSGNLILTRLLIPGDFGLMQLVAVFMQGIAMFSDLGISLNIIQHKKGEEPGFLRTAWTIQFFRGILIALIMLLLAKPLAFVYGAPSLAWLIPLAGSCVIVEGMCSMNLAVYNRKMKMAKLTWLDLGSQLVGMLAMIACAWYWRSVWTLLVSGFVSGLMRTVFSHILFPQPSMAFTWIKDDVKEIVDFGKWIFISSMGGFLVSRLDRVILGLYLTTTELGLYGLALALPTAILDVVQTLAQKILLPLYSHLWKTSLKKLKTETFKVRSSLVALSLPPLFALIIWGQSIFDFLYPPNYHGAGWMLQILAVSCCFKSINSNITPIFYAVGDSFRAMIVTFSAVILLIISMLVGGYYFGTKGVIWAVPVSELLSYPVLVMMVKRYGVWLPSLDIPSFIATLAVVIIMGLI